MSFSSRTGISAKLCSSNWKGVGVYRGHKTDKQINIGLFSPLYCRYDKNMRQCEKMKQVWNTDKNSRYSIHQTVETVIALSVYCKKCRQWVVEHRRRECRGVKRSRVKWARVNPSHRGGVWQGISKKNVNIDLQMAIFAAFWMFLLSSEIAFLQSSSIRMRVL